MRRQTQTDTLSGGRGTRGARRVTARPGLVESAGGGYMLTLVERGADLLAASGQIGEATAAALKAEARRRAEAGAFFGHIAYASLTAARRPS